MTNEPFVLDRILPRIIMPLAIAAVVFLLAGSAMTYFYAVPERMMGIAQFIMYLHVPAAFITYLLYAVLFIGSCLYLWDGREGWDALASAAGSVGMGFATVMILTGPLWAKPVWGHFWTWDPRLTSAFILWLIYCVYLLLRLVVDRPDKQARFCAVLAVLGAADIPIIHYSVEWWNATHPKAIVMQKKLGGGLGDPSMSQTLLVCFIAQLLLGLTLLAVRYYQIRLNERVTAVQNEIERSRHLRRAPAEGVS